jgi:DNA polymerase III subunit gamma/tau
MAYQVLARKWRPRIFSEMAGQEHVLRTLINALDQDRLHHAYLFTGTRGVGKTTIARILAKCLNCEQGISSSPCEACSACISIAEGRFLDLIEVDAASRTKVDDTRELLENVQYAPSVGRFKVYLIDEVHMLSAHSFNALLKTLEEPPAHVKFLFATTDPQKLPVTILSRCLQFNLKNISPEIIVEHLKHILGKEEVTFEEPGLWSLARAADGSMRDALSLTDQAISYGAGKLTEFDISNMLGSIDLAAIAEIARGLVDRDGPGVMASIQKMSELAPDYSTALGGLLSLLHRVAVAQAIPSAIDNSQGDKDLILEIAGNLSSEDVQLFYQIALLGRRDLPLAPEPRIGFEMVMLRILAFYPIYENKIDPPAETQVATDGSIVIANDIPIVPKTELREASELEKKSKDVKLDFKFSDLRSKSLDTKNVESLKSTNMPADSGYENNSLPLAEPEVMESEIITVGVADKVLLEHVSSETWFKVYEGLTIGGPLRNIAANLALNTVQDVDLFFVLDESQSAIYSPVHESRLAVELSMYFGTPVKVAIEVGVIAAETPQSRRARLQEERQAAATESLQSDPNVHDIMNIFGGVLLKNTIKAIN